MDRFGAAYVRVTANRRCFRLFLTVSEPKNTLNADVFGTSEAENHGIYVLFAPGSNKHGICSVFWPRPSKNIGIYISMLQEELHSCQRHKNMVNYNIFVLGKQQKNSKNSPKSVQNGILHFFFLPRTLTTCKPHQPEGFWGGLGGGVPPGS